jgi:nucleoid DNA-binding protein
MGRDDVARKVAERVGLPICRVRQILDAVLDVKLQALAEGTPVAFDEFGVYRVRRNKSRTINAVNTGERITIPETLSVWFRPSPRVGEMLTSSAAARCRTV